MGAIVYIACVGELFPYSSIYVCTKIFEQAAIPMYRGRTIEVVLHKAACSVVRLHTSGLRLVCSCSDSAGVVEPVVPHDAAANGMQAAQGK